jgi:hypothetical protein
MLDREMGIITDELSRLAQKSGMSHGELEAACRMWFEQYGQRWHDVGMATLKERCQDVNPRMLEDVERVLSL